MFPVGRDKVHDNGEVEKRMGKDYCSEGIEYFQGRFFEVEESHKEAVEEPIIAKEDDKAKDNQDRGDDKGDRADSFYQALAPKGIVCQQIGPGKAENQGSQGTDGCLGQRKKHDLECIGTGEGLNDPGKGKGAFPEEST
jgi:hypothetical protein